MALLEADVALPVVRDFIARVKDKALGQDVVGSLSPGQALVGIVHRELTATMGETDEHGTLKPVAELNFATQPPAVILMAGLQGAGKTTTTAKLAKHLIEKRKKKVLTVSADVYRPAAIEQLKTVTRQAGAEWFESTPEQKPARHRAGRARPCQAPLLRRAAGRHRRPAGHRRSADGRDPRPARGAQADRDAVRRRCHAGPGRGQHRQGLQGRAAADRRGADQARRRLARRRGAVGAPGDRRADQVCRRVREDRRPGGLRRRAPRRPRARHGRHRRAGRAGAEQTSTSRPRRSWPTRSRAAATST